MVTGRYEEKCWRKSLAEIWCWKSFVRNLKTLLGFKAVIWSVVPWSDSGCKFNCNFWLASFLNAMQCSCLILKRRIPLSYELLVEFHDISILFVCHSAHWLWISWTCSQNPITGTKPRFYVKKARERLQRMGPPRGEASHGGHRGHRYFLIGTVALKSAMNSNLYRISRISLGSADPNGKL